MTQEQFALIYAAVSLCSVLVLGTGLTLGWRTAMGAVVGMLAGFGLVGLVGVTYEFGLGIAKYLGIEG